MTSYVLDPYLSGINPGTESGKTLYIAAIKSIKNDSDRIDVSPSKVTEMLDLLNSLSSKFVWGELMRVNVSSNNVPSFKNLLLNHDTIKLDHVRTAAWGYMSDGVTNVVPGGNIEPPASMEATAITPDTDASHIPLFHKRVRAKMIAKALEGHLTQSSMRKLLLHKKQFRWVDADGIFHDDGPTMVKLILAIINPSTCIGMQCLKVHIETATLSKHANNVVDMLDFMQENYDKIIAANDTFDDLVRHIFRALLTCPNHIFRDLIQRTKDDWDIGGDIDADSLSLMAKTKYNNMFLAGEWTQLDPKDAKIAALTTRLATIEQLRAGNPTPSSKTSGTIGSDTLNVAGMTNLPVWRTIKKGESIVSDGKTYHWCPHHVLQGKFDGLYMPHKAEEHDAWKAEKKERRDKYNKKSSAPPSNEPTPSSVSDAPTLGLSERMKAALLTDCGMPQSDVDRMLKAYEALN